MINKKILFLELFFGLFLANITKAVCPACVVAVGAGLGFSEWLGIDDVISSIWIGALLISITWWTLVEIRKRNWSFKFDTILIFLSYYLLTFIPLYYSGILGHPLNKIFGIDKIIFGTALGTIISLLGHWFSVYLKNKNNGKVFFYYQKVIIPIIILILTSLILWIII